MQKTVLLTLGWEDPLEKKIATHSIILAWEILWTELEKPGGVYICVCVYIYTYIYIYIDSPWGHKESDIT